MSVIKSAGILPIAKSTISHYNDWLLAGHGDPYEDCGQFRYFGCFNKEKHKANLKIPYNNFYVGKAVKRNCNRLRCSVCFWKAAYSRSMKIEKRLRAYKTQRYTNPIHVIVSPPPKINDSFTNLRTKALRSLKKCGIVGGVMVVHHFRCRDYKYDVPGIHFHVIGYGWVSGTKENFEKENIIVKNVGIRKSVRKTASYLLGHCSVIKCEHTDCECVDKTKYHTIVWFGGCSYNKLKVIYEVENFNLCNYCNEPMKAFDWESDRYGEPPDEEKTFTFNRKDWKMVSVNYG